MLIFDLKSSYNKLEIHVWLLEHWGYLKLVPHNDITGETQKDLM